MQNEIHFISKAQASSLKQSIEQEQNTLLVEINGNEVQSWTDYIAIIEDGFDLPKQTVNSIDSYLDWMRDLSWLDKESFVLIINDYDEFLKDDLPLKAIILEDYKDTLLPWWQSERASFVVNGQLKPFNIYLVT
ncbi:MAG: barstar family protein [Coriobacteriia bacterium]|nr:barstar family protein [Coriobacteriia bacterium]